eukprot:Amastigsp_a340683_130.p3 type:complete len:135 gc:universal Amastigsp_a340683_130:136-540(+)
MRCSCDLRYSAISPWLTLPSWSVSAAENMSRKYSSNTAAGTNAVRNSWRVIRPSWFVSIIWKSARLVPRLRTSRASIEGFLTSMSCSSVASSTPSLLTSASSNSPWSCFTNAARALALASTSALLRSPVSVRRR